MNEFFEAIDYRVSLKILIDDLKENDADFDGLSYKHIEEETLIKSSYLSAVFNEKKHFNSDQLYSLGEFLKLDDERIDFLLLLHELSRTEIKSRKDKILEKLKKIRSQKIKAIQIEDIVVKDSDEDLAQYYLSPETMICHMYFGIPKYARNIQLVKEKLSLDEFKFKEALEILMKLNMIQMISDNHVRVLKKIVYLSRNSKLFEASDKLMNIYSFGHSQKVSEDRKTSIISTFATNEESYLLVENEVNNCFKRIAKIVDNDQVSDEIYQINISLFPW